MIWIDPQGNQYQEKPQRVRLADMTTRTAEAVTDELLYELGWQQSSEVIQETVVNEPEIQPDSFDSIGGA